MFQMIVNLVLVAMAATGALLADHILDRSDPTNAAILAIILLVGLGGFVMFYLAMLVPNLAVAARRMQDQNIPGVVGIGLVIGGMLFGLPYLAMAVFGFIDGTPGANQFGPDPKRERQVKSVFD